MTAIHSPSESAVCSARRAVVATASRRAAWNGERVQAGAATTSPILQDEGAGCRASRSSWLDEHHQAAAAARAKPATVIGRASRASAPQLDGPAEAPDAQLEHAPGCRSAGRCRRCAPPRAPGRRRATLVTQFMPRDSRLGHRPAARLVLHNPADAPPRSRHLRHLHGRAGRARPRGRPPRHRLRRQRLPADERPARAPSASS